MSDLILDELPRLARRPSPKQLLDRIRRREPVPGDSAADLTGAERSRR